MNTFKPGDCLLLRGFDQLPFWFLRRENNMVFVLKNKVYNTDNVWTSAYNQAFKASGLSPCLMKQFDPTWDVAERFSLHPNPITL